MFGSTSRLCAFLLLVGLQCFAQGQWPFAGHDLQDTRYQNTESKIGVANVAGLAGAWSVSTSGDVLTTPAVDGSTVYFPDSAGNLYAVDKKNGKLVWVQSLLAYTGIQGDLSVTTPAVAGNLLFIGDEGGLSGAGAKLLAISKQTGALVWAITLDNHPAAIVTQSPVVGTVNGQQIVYVGVNSIEDVLAGNSTYPCCTFRGSMVAVNAATGQVVWKTFTVPSGYSGAAIQGGTPAVDSGRGSLYMVTGSNYTVPGFVLDCLNNSPNSAACVAPDDLFDSIVALDLANGAVKWATHTIPYDAWNTSCAPGAQTAANCPIPTGPGFDFSQGAALFTASTTLGRSPLVGAGQRSGRYWALDPNTGAARWSTQVVAGSHTGGLGFGAAVDGIRVYVADATTGSWTALDAFNGSVIWQTPDPSGVPDLGPVAVANGVAYACSLDGHMYALNTANGAIVWTFPTPGSCASGASVSNGTVYWGSGYSQAGGPNHQVFAFQTP